MPGNAPHRRSVRTLRLQVTCLGKDTEYELPVTQEQIADATELTSVRVNRTMKVLEHEGLNDRFAPAVDYH